MWTSANCLLSLNLYSLICKNWEVGVKAWLLETGHMCILGLGVGVPRGAAFPSSPNMTSGRGGRVEVGQTTAAG